MGHGGPQLRKMERPNQVEVVCALERTHTSNAVHRSTRELKKAIRLGKKEHKKSTAIQICGQIIASLHDIGSMDSGTRNRIKRFGILYAPIGACPGHWVCEDSSSLT